MEVKTLLLLFIICLTNTVVLVSCKNLYSINRNKTSTNITTINAITDIVRGIPLYKLTVVYDDNITDSEFVSTLSQTLNKNEITTKIFRLRNGKKAMFNFLNMSVIANNKVTCIFFCKNRTAVRILKKIMKGDLIRRNLLYIFYWGHNEIGKEFTKQIHDAMRIVVITNPRINAYRVFYNQATSYRQHYLKLVNWWIQGKGLYQHPTLPSSKKIYSDFHGRIFKVPVVHKPPWHFVTYNENGSSIKVEGGRDDKLLKLISDKLNFRFEYFDPPDRNQGSSIMNNGSFKGVLGLLWTREAEFFLGDVAINLERSKAVEFSFLTLADSGAFVTHSPGRLNEALALILPFQWQVWPPVIATLVLSGPVLFAVIALPGTWRQKTRNTLGSRLKLFLDCVWFTISVFLRQSGKEPSHSHKARLFMIVLSIAVTYVIGDMYSANLTSLLARPGREKPISTLSQLEKAMRDQGYELYVERHSSSYTMLENGTGVYACLWNLMKKQRHSLIDSVEMGVKMVRNSKNRAVIAGRETLYFDTRRFGAGNFYLSEKLYTGYSAIAFQYGCPYIENFNKILTKLFEGGILTKMTVEEYEKLGELQHVVDVETGGGAGTEGVPPGVESKESIATAAEEEQKSKPISLSMLQGAFYILLIGYILSAVCLILELSVKKYKGKYDGRREKCRKLNKLFGRCQTLVETRYWQVYDWAMDKLHQIIVEESLSSLEYIE